MSIEVPPWIQQDERLDLFRRLPFDEALLRVLAAWREAPALHLGPGPTGSIEVPFEFVLAEWLACEHPESEALLYDCLDDDQVYVRAYCLFTLLLIGSRLLLTLPPRITECAEIITRCNSCSCVQAPFWNLFKDQVKSNSLMFAGDRAERPSGYWRHSG